ncbi:MAG: hypothetical protein ACK50V_00420 [Alphaproteobacteria bacterium]
MSYLALALQHVHQLHLENKKISHLATKKVEIFLRDMRNEIIFLRKSEERKDTVTAHLPSLLSSPLVYEYKTVDPRVKYLHQEKTLVFLVYQTKNMRKELHLDRRRLISYLGVQDVRVGTEKTLFSPKGRPIRFTLLEAQSLTIYVKELFFLKTFFKEKSYDCLFLLGIQILLLFTFYTGNLRGSFMTQKKAKDTHVRQQNQIETLTRAYDDLSQKTLLYEENRELLALKTKKEKELQEEVRRRNTRALEKISVLSSVVQSSLLNPELYEEKECLSLLSDISSSATDLKDGLPRQTLCEATPLESLVEDVLMLLRHDAGKAGISLQNALLSPGIEAHTDPLLLKLVLSYIVKKSLSLLYEGRVIVSLSVVGEMPLIRILQEGESVHEDRLFTNDKRVIAGIILDQRLMESLCQRLNLRALKISSHETHLFVGESDALPEKIPSYIFESSPNVIPLFS